MLSSMKGKSGQKEPGRWKRVVPRREGGEKSTTLTQRVKERKEGIEEGIFLDGNGEKDTHSKGRIPWALICKAVGLFVGRHIVEKDGI